MQTCQTASLNDSTESRSFPKAYQSMHYIPFAFTHIRRTFFKAPLPVTFLPSFFLPDAKCSRNTECSNVVGRYGEKTICCVHPDPKYEKYNPGCFVAKGSGYGRPCIVPSTIPTTSITTTTTVTPTPTLANVFARMTCATKYNIDLLNTKIQTFDEQDSLGLAMSDLVGNGASFYFLDAAGPDPLYSKNCPKDVQTLNKVVGDGYEFYCGSIYLAAEVMLRKCTTQLLSAITTTLATTSAVASTAAFRDPCGYYQLQCTAEVNAIAACVSAVHVYSLYSGVQSCFHSPPPL